MMAGADINVKYHLLLGILLYIAGSNWLTAAGDSGFGRYKRGWLDDLLGNALASLSNRTNAPESTTTTQESADLTISQSPFSNTLLVFNHTTTSYGDTPEQTTVSPYTTSKAPLNASAILGQLFENIAKESRSPSTNMTNVAYTTTVLPINSTAYINYLFGNSTQSFQELNDSAAKNVPVNNESTLSTAPHIITDPPPRTGSTTAINNTPNVTLTSSQTDTVLSPQGNDTVSIQFALKDIWDTLANSAVQSTTETATEGTTETDVTSAFVNQTKKVSDIVTSHIGNSSLENANNDSVGIQITGENLANILHGLLGNASSNNTDNITLALPGYDTSPPGASQLEDGSNSAIQDTTSAIAITSPVIPNTSFKDQSRDRNSASNLVYTTTPTLNENAVNAILQKLFNSITKESMAPTSDYPTSQSFTQAPQVNVSHTSESFPNDVSIETTTGDIISAIPPAVVEITTSSRRAESSSAVIESSTFQEAVTKQTPIGESEHSLNVSVINNILNRLINSTTTLSSYRTNDEQTTIVSSPVGGLQSTMPTADQSLNKTAIDNIINGVLDSTNVSYPDISTTPIMNVLSRTSPGSSPLQTSTASLLSDKDINDIVNQIFNTNKGVITTALEPTSSTDGTTSKTIVVPTAGKGATKDRSTSGGGIWVKPELFATTLLTMAMVLHTS